MPAGYGVNYVTVGQGHRIPAGDYEMVQYRPDRDEYYLEREDGTVRFGPFMGPELMDMQENRVADDIRNWVRAQANFTGVRDISGSGYARNFIDFTKVEGGESMRGDGTTTRGSYAYAVAQLAEGLNAGVEAGWITADEAKVEFRKNVETVNAADMHKQYEADRIAQLEKELAEIREKQEAESS